MSWTTSTPSFSSLAFSCGGPRIRPCVTAEKFGWISCMMVERRRIPNGIRRAAIFTHSGAFVQSPAATETVGWQPVLLGGGWVGNLEGRRKIFAPAAKRLLTGLPIPLEFALFFQDPKKH